MYIYIYIYIFISKILNKIIEKNLDWWDMWHVWRRGGACTGFWWGNLRERDQLEDPGVDRRIILRWIFRKCYVEA
jgi:hypothetical protein